MPAEALIPATDFCVHHRLDIAFVYDLEQRGLIEIVRMEQTTYLPTDQLSRLEKLLRLHRELAVHPDDLDIVAHLLDRLEAVQEEVMNLRNRLFFYERAGE